MRLRAVWICLLLTFALSWPATFAASGERVLLKTATPVYPELAKKMRVYGSIRLGITILPSGEVGAIVLQSGHPLLVGAAEEAVKKWKYASAPETTTTSVVVRFDLPE